MSNLIELFCHLDDFWLLYADTHHRRLLVGRQHPRAVIETIIDQLKNISQIGHTRHRRFTNFCVNLVCGLIAYCHQRKKPSLHLVGDTECAILIQN